MSRGYTAIDRLLIEIDQSLRTVYGSPQVTERADPADGVAEDAPLDESDRRLSGRLMRINHAGEVAAQGLYQGQAFTAHSDEVREQMRRSALEENDHLAWCGHRLEALDAHTSRLSPFWYWGSFAIGALAGAVGDRWSLGFVTETERQVESHLDDHLERLPPEDHKSRAVLEQMREDEIHHAEMALQAGAAELPGLIKGLMTGVSRLMTRTAYWL
jgi:ubiquinone biosynthesis monooxygenase Coq7